jgi:Fes/CIP4, and EFC/F-BAR homology domain
VLGLGVLFGKLQQGVAENQQILTIARMRAEAEEVYGTKLGEIGTATDKITGGFSRDDGASVRKVRLLEMTDLYPYVWVDHALTWGVGI